jgi:hypothetical protein
LTLNVGGNAAIVGFKVERDSNAVPSAVFGEPVPVDPGEHVLVASAPGYEAWRMSISVTAPGSSQAIAIPPLTPLPAPLPEAAAPPAATAPAAVGTPKDAPPEQQHHPDLTWAFVSAGVGAVGLGVGVVFGLKASNLDKDAEEHCEGAACFDAKGPELSSDARSAALLANIGYGVGAVGLGTAVVLAIMELQDDEPPVAAQQPRAKWSLAPEVGVGTASLQMRGQF